jgi:hypothetical protein
MPVIAPEPARVVASGKVIRTVSGSANEPEAAETDEQDAQCEFGGVRHLLAGFLALVFGLGQVAFRAAAAEHCHAL